MQGARWWRETTSESTNTNARKKKKKLKKWETKQEEELYTHIQTSQQQEPHTKWQKYISFISSVIVTPSVYLSVFCVRT